MKGNSVQEVSAALGIPKDTLRYYDKLGLVSPRRGENKYRRYTDRDMLDLQYVEILKYADFSLVQIRQFFNYMRCLASAGDCDNIQKMFERKKANYIQRIKTYKAMLGLVERILETKNKIKSPLDIGIADDFVTNIFKGIERGRHEK
ncbi:MAG: MerR family transcriptional regulator [Clostridiales bacterium]|jgi:DNA-binding transcriptional MerR regulator|nr:MerR family transcriptional regulator [Clostridiales bacterium]